MLRHLSMTLALLASSAASAFLTTGDMLDVGESIYSRNGDYALTLRADGDLVLSKNERQIVWRSATQGLSASYAVLRADGSFALHGRDDEVLWSSGTGSPIGNRGAVLSLQNDGQLIVYRPSLIWKALAAQNRDTMAHINDERWQQALFGTSGGPQQPARVVVRHVSAMR